VNRLAFRTLIIGAAVVALLAVLERLPAQHVPHRPGLPSLHRAVSARLADSLLSPKPGGGGLAPITIDYPADGSIFPP
jgi:hypothetical protein